MVVLWHFVRLSFWSLRFPPVEDQDPDPPQRLSTVVLVVFFFSKKKRESSKRGWGGPGGSGERKAGFTGVLEVLLSPPPENCYSNITVSEINAVEDGERSNSTTVEQ